ncbi:MAG TPA: hypothetical protein QF683_00075, partial [SAR324 cluster bacterium]|nr:hypothetical protein [SAR324 cluster bacterium]
MSMDNVSISIPVEDFAGNRISNVDSTDNGSFVFVDRDAPSILNVSLDSSNPNGAFARAGDNLTLNFTTSESIQDPLQSMSIQGLGSIALNSTNNGTLWTAAGQVLNNSSGSPALSLTVLDQAGNRGSPLYENHSFTNISPDTTLPELRSLDFVSSNKPDNSSIYAKALDTLTLSFRFQEPVQQPVVSIAGNNLSIQLTHNSDNTSWEAVYTVQAGDNGSAGFSIAYQDLAGNAGTLITNTDDFSSIPGTVRSITMDTNAPSLSRIHVESDNLYDRSLAKIGDNITLSFDSDEPLMTPFVDLAGSMGLSAVDNSSATQWYVGTGVDSSTPEDNVSFQFDIEDLAGNVTPGITPALGQSLVRVDLTQPEISGISLVSTNDNGSWAKAGDNVTLEFSTSEAVVAPSIVIAGNIRPADNRSLDGKAWKTVYHVQNEDNGSVNWNFAVMDLAGNVSDNVTQDYASLITMDTTAPEVMDVVFLSKGDNPSFARSGDELEFSFSTSETVKEVRIRLNDNNLLESFASYSDVHRQQWTSVFVVDDNVSKWSASETGSVVKFDFEATDYAGNKKVRNCFSGTWFCADTGLDNRITVDIKSPEITAVTLDLSPEKSVNIAKGGDTVELKFSVSDDTINPRVMINGVDRSESVSEGSLTNQWQVTYSIPDHRAEVRTEDVGYSLIRPWGIAEDPNGNFYISDYERHVVLKFGSNGEITEIGNANLPGDLNGMDFSQAQFRNPAGLAVDQIGNIYVADQKNDLIRVIHVTGEVSTLIDDNDELNDPTDLVFDLNGDLVVADSLNSRVVKINVVDQSITELGQNLQFSRPSGLFSAINGDIYVADRGSHKIYRIEPNGTAEIWAGSEKGYQDGAHQIAKFDEPYDIA